MKRNHTTTKYKLSYTINILHLSVGTNRFMRKTLKQSGDRKIAGEKHKEKICLSVCLSV